MKKAMQRAGEMAELECMLREARAAKIAMARLEHPLILAKAAAEKAKTKRKDRAQKLANALPEQAALEPVRSNAGSLEKRRRVCTLADDIDNEEQPTPEEIAYGILWDLHNDLFSRCRYYEEQVYAIEKKQEREIEALARKYRGKQEAEHDAGN